jgi:hypothetical protein
MHQQVATALASSLAQADHALAQATYTSRLLSTHARVCTLVRTHAHTHAFAGGLTTTHCCPITRGVALLGSRA